MPPELVGLLGESQAAVPECPGHKAVREALHALGLDLENFGTAEWNPLGSLVQPGSRVVLKPNFIRHWNPKPGAEIDCVITHGSILRAAADYAFLAVGSEGSVVVAEAPQQDCDWNEIQRIVGLDAIAAEFAALGRSLELIDLRREAVRFRDGVIVSREPLPGDPKGYRAVDLGASSFFEGSDLDPRRFRGADYDPGPTTWQHMGGRNAYLLSETVLSSDLIVNLPKLKTHKKTGVTLALKNLVGINGDKNWLPHHSVGCPENGGDEFPERRLLDSLRSFAIDLVRPLLARGIGSSVVRLGRRLEDRTRGQDFIRSGNWYGNDTTWRMCCDLNRCVAYSDRHGLHLDAPEPVRRTLTILDGIVAGEGEGPLAPREVPLGVVLAATDPIAIDLLAVRLMGFDELRIPKLMGPMRDPLGPRITAVRSAADVQVMELQPGQAKPRERRLDEIDALHHFAPHDGWKGHIEVANSCVMDPIEGGEAPPR